MAEKYITPQESVVPSWDTSQTYDTRTPEEMFPDVPFKDKVESTVGAAYTGTWRALNSFAIGLPSLAEAATIGQTSIGQKLKEIRKEHETAGTVGEVVGDLGALFTPFLGEAKAAALSARAAESVGTKVATSELLTKFLSQGSAEQLSKYVAKESTKLPASVRYAKNVAEGMTAAGIASFAHATEDMDLNGFSMDSAKSHGMNLLTNMLYGGAIGGAFTGVGQAFEGAASWRAAKKAKGISQDSKDGLKIGFDLAIQDAKTPEAKGIIAKNWGHVENTIKEFEEDSKTVEGQLSERFKKNELFLDTFIGNPDFLNKTIHSGQPMGVGKVLQSVDFVSDLRNSLSKELGIPPDDINPRSILTEKLYKSAQGVTEQEGKLIDIRKRLTNSMSNSFAGTAPLKEQAQRASFLTNLDDAQAEIEALGTEDGALERALSSNRIASKSEYNRINEELNTMSPTDATSLRESYARPERGPSESDFNKYKKSLLDVIKRSKVGANKLNSYELYTRLNRSLDESNEVYGLIKEDAKSGFRHLPKEYTNLFNKLHGRLNSVARDETLWGDAAKAHQDLKQIVHKKMNVKNAIMKVLSQTEGKKVSKGVEYKDGVADIVKSKTTDFDPKAFSKLKTLGMANGNLESKLFSEQYIGGFIDNTIKETDLLSKWIGQRSSQLIQDLDVNVPNRISALRDEIQSLENMKADPLTRNSQTAQTADSQIKDLYEQIASLEGETTNQIRSELSQLASDKDYVGKANGIAQYEKTSFSDNAIKLKKYNDRRTQAWMNFWDNAARLQKTAAGKEKPFTFHSGGNNPQLEMMRLGRDAMTGNTRGVGLAATQLGFWGGARLVESIMNNIGHTYSPERAFMTSKESFLRANKNLLRSTRGTRILSKQGKESKLGFGVRTSTSALVGRSEGDQ